MLEIAGLHKSFSTAQGPLRVLRGIDLTLRAGDTVALTGESGSGKSTLLHIAAGLEPADAGSVKVGGVNLAEATESARAAVRRDMVGLIFQQFNLIPSLCVADNLSFQARLAGNHDATWLDTLARRLGLEDAMPRYPENLSGGQQQRVAIGRALAARPPLILADEPTGNLDEETGDEVLALLLELVATTGAALLLVTHSRRLARRLARTCRLHGGHLE
ncbi:MAG: ABC transporter ATP-binding protein [Paracoccaceae bacterium]